MRPLGPPEQYELCKVFLADGETATIHPNGAIEARGTLWECIEQAYERYQHLGMPSLETYQLTAVATPERVDLYAQIGEEAWRL